MSDNISSAKVDRQKGKGSKWGGFINLVSFVTIICIGLSLIVGRLGIGSISGAFRTIADVLAYVVTIMASFIFVIKCRKFTCYLVWVICVTTIVLLLIL